jgi:hypothetical protein
MKAEYAGLWHGDSVTHRAGASDGTTRRQLRGSVADGVASGWFRQVRVQEKALGGMSSSEGLKRGIRIPQSFRPGRVRGGLSWPGPMLVRDSFLNSRRAAAQVSNQFSLSPRLNRLTPPLVSHRVGRCDSNRGPRCRAVPDCKAASVFAPGCHLMRYNSHVGT